MADTASSRTTPALLTASWARRDGHREITYLAALGAATAAAIAIYGLPGVDLHPPLHRLGIMDPLCGGTRAARFAAQGQVAEAWTYNPLGIVTVYGAGIALLRAALGLLGGRWLTITVAWTPRRRRVAWLVAAVLFVALEVRQQSRADLLMQTL